MKFTLHKLTDFEEVDDTKITADMLRGKCEVFNTLPGALIHFRLDDKGKMIHTEYTDNNYDDSEFDMDGTPIKSIINTHLGMQIYAKARHGKDKGWVITDIVRKHGKNLRVFDYEQLKDFCESYKLDYVKSIRTIPRPTTPDFKALCESSTPGNGVILKNYDYLCLYECIGWISLTCEKEDKK